MKNKWYKPKRHWKETELWKDVPEEKWNDWLWQLTHTVRTLDDLKKVINLTEDEEEGVRISTKTIPLNITPYYASLMDTTIRDARYACSLCRFLKKCTKQYTIWKTRFMRMKIHRCRSDTPLSRPCAVSCHESMFHVLPLLHKKALFRTNRNGSPQKTA